MLNIASFICIDFIKTAGSKEAFLLLTIKCHSINIATCTQWAVNRKGKFMCFS
jgi:hypothetical protein